MWFILALSDRNCMTWRANDGHPSKDEEISFQAANFDSIGIPDWMRADLLFRLIN
jgi:hypothetical protein